MNKKKDLCEFNRGMVVDVKWVGLSFSDAADLPVHQSFEFKQNETNTQTHTQNTEWVGKMARLVLNCQEEYSNSYNHSFTIVVSKKASQNTHK